MAQDGTLFCCVDINFIEVRRCRRLDWRAGWTHWLIPHRFDETVAFNVRVGSNASDSEVAAALARSVLI